MRWSAVAVMIVGLGCGDGRTGSDGGVARDGAIAALDGAHHDAASSTMRGRVGDRCSRDGECPVGMQCFTRFDNPLTGGVVAQFPNGFCSTGCEDLDDCGNAEGVTCAMYGTSSGASGTTLNYCTPQCRQNSDCRAADGYRCATLLGFGFCAPPM